MSWIDLIVGAGIAATAYSSGHGIGMTRGRVTERNKAPKLACSCKHGYGSHEAGGKCHADVKRANRWGRMKGYDGDDHEVGWEYVTCPCMAYDGPEPPINVLSWTPPTSIPPTGGS